MAQEDYCTKKTCKATGVPLPSSTPRGWSARSGARQKQKHETGMDTRTVGTMPTLDSFDNKLDRALRTTLVDGVPGESEATPRLLFCGGVCILDWNRRTAPLQYRHRNELLLQIMIDAKAEE